MLRNDRIKTVLFLVLCFLIGAVPVYAEVTARVGSDRITIDESVNLRVESTNADGSPDFAGLENDFTILGTSTQSQTQITNGRMQQSRTWNLELLPKRVGQLVIPAIQVGDGQSTPIDIEVMNAREFKPGDDIGDYHVDVQVDTRSPFVQAQVLYTIRVYHTERLLEGSLGSPATEGVIIEQLGEDQLMRATRNGRQYRVLERKLAVFPQKSGTLKLPGVLLDASVSADGSRVQGFFTPTTKVRRRSAALSLEVQPKPDDTGWWLPARAVSIDAIRGENESDSLHVGESFTRTIRLSAIGVNGAQLPAITLPDSDRYRVYADQPTIRQTVESSGLGAERIEKWAVVAQAPGELTLPEIRVPWFNVDTGQQEVAILPAETLTILPAVNEAPLPDAGNAAISAPVPSSSVSPSSESDIVARNDNAAVATPTDASPGNAGTAEIPSENGEVPTEPALVVESALSGVSQGWKIAAITLGVLWLATVVALLRAVSAGGRSVFSRLKRSRQSVDLTAIRQACQQRDSLGLARAIVNFGQTQWADNPRHSVLSVAAAIDDPELEDELTRLDQAAYAANSGVDSDQAQAAPNFAKIYTSIKRYAKANQPAKGRVGRQSGIALADSATTADNTTSEASLQASPEAASETDALPRL